MIAAHEPGKFAVRFYYDDVGRIAAKRDHRGNVVQFVYSNPYSNATVSHVHYPKASRTYHLIYDDQDFLVAMDTPDSRFYIATDHLGSPIAVFDYKGKLIKEISRSPFGKVTRDTNPGMDIPIDFAGGLVDQVPIFSVFCFVRKMFGHRYYVYHLCTYRQNVIRKWPK
jgi:YD repeat-containing protein